MSWGKEKYRYKFIETSDSIATIINNYRDLDQEYQKLGKALLDIKEYIKENKEDGFDEDGYDDAWYDKVEVMPILDIINKALGDKENE